jgi:hypothetical protein
MCRLLAVLVLLSSCAAAAQTDERRVRTVQTDDVAEQAAPAEPDDPVEQRTDPAEHPDEHMVLARQLVSLGEDGAADAESGAACAPSEAIGADLKAAYRARPGDFLGISPQSAYWPEVKRAWHADHGDRCAGVSDDTPAAMLARSYAEQLSSAELRAVIAFQNSPSGRAFIAATQRARTELDQELATRNGQDRPETFEAAMLRLKAKYESDPK